MLSLSCYFHCRSSRSVNVWRLIDCSFPHYATLDKIYNHGHLGGMFSYVGFNSSFLLVLGLIWWQYTAVTFPRSYRSIVTTRRVLTCIGFSCAYFTSFILLQFAAVPLQTLLQVDVHIHSTLITVLLMLSSFMLLRSFRKFAHTTRRLRGAREHTSRTCANK